MVAALVSDVVPACGATGVMRSQFPVGLCRGAEGRCCLEGTLPAEAFLADAKLERSVHKEI